MVPADLHALYSHAEHGGAGRNDPACLRSFQGHDVMGNLLFMTKKIYRCTFLITSSIFYLAYYS